MESEKLFKYIGEKSWGGKGEHGTLAISIVKIGDIQYIKAVDSYYDDYNVSTLMNQTTKLEMVGENWFENKSVEDILFRINCYVDSCYKKFTAEEIKK